MYRIKPNTCVQRRKRQAQINPSPPSTAVVVSFPPIFPVGKMSREIRGKEILKRKEEMSVTRKRKTELPDTVFNHRQLVSGMLLGVCGSFPR
jgi:hypothetical protein